MADIDRAILEYHKDGFTVEEIAELVRVDEAAVAMSLQMMSKRASNTADVKEKFKEHQDTIFQTIMDMINDPETDQGTRAKLLMYSNDINIGRKMDSSKSKTRINVLTINKHIHQARNAYAEQMRGIIDVPDAAQQLESIDSQDSDMDDAPSIYDNEGRGEEAVKVTRQKYIEREHKHLLTIPEDT